MVWIRNLREQLRTSLWFLPALFALLGAGLAVVLVAVDHQVSRDPGSMFFAFGGSAEGARSVLSTIAQSMLTFTGLVFTITMLVLQLASSQLSPRVMRTFLRDRGNQVVLGVFVATFVYTLLVLREVRNPVDSSAGFVPGLSVWVAFTLLLLSVAAFVYYIDHMAHAIRASTVITNIWRETSAAVDRLYPERIGEAAEAEAAPDFGPPDRVLEAPSAGVVDAIDEERILDLADRGDRRLELLSAIGEYVPEGAPLVRLWGGWDDGDGEAVLGAIGQGEERTLEQDAAFGIRQLVDVALRALSPGTNDPTTATQALDRIHDLLRRIVVRRIPSPVRSGKGGRPRLLLARPGWEDYLGLGLTEVRLAGANQVQVVHRLRVLLEDLASVAPEDRLPPIRRELAGLSGPPPSGGRVGDR